MKFFLWVYRSLLIIKIITLSETGNLSAQNRETGISGYSDLIEEIAGVTDNEEDLQQIVDDLNELLNNPLDINSATENDLQKLFLLNDFQIKSIINYREENGNFLSVNELLLVPGIQPDLFRKVSQFFSNPDRKAIENHKISYVNIKNDLIIRYKIREQVPAGFKDEMDSTRHFAGNARYLMARYELSAGNKFKAGFIAEQDPGEPLFSSFNKYNPDHFSGFVEFNSQKKPFKLIAGDFKAGFGQGLVRGQSFIAKASTGIMLPEKNTITRSISSSESGHLRGIAFQMQTGRLRLSSYLSGVKHDAAIKKYIQENDSLFYFSSINKTGLHRNLVEIKNRNTLKQFNAGIDFTYMFKSISLGFFGEINSFSLPMEYYEFNSGNNTTNYISNFYNCSIHYKINFQKVLIYGEWASDQFGHMALLNGITAQLHPLATLSMIHRKYSPVYRSFSASGFGKSSSIKNEEGIYMAMHIYLFSFLSLSCNADHYVFPYLQNDLSPPSSGSDYMINAIFMFARESQFTIRYRVSNQQINSFTGMAGVNPNSKNSLSSWRLVSTFNLNESLMLESRFELSENQEYPDNYSNGIYLGQKLVLKSKSNKLSFYSSYGLFDTQDWKTRIYIYEHDLLYDFSIPALYRKGSRFSLMFRIALTSNSQIWIKYYMTHYPQEVERGSGADKVISDKDSGIKLQWRVLL